MVICSNEADVREYMGYINRSVQEHPILVDKYLMGLELEVDAISDGDHILIPGIMEHLERAGVHSGDSISIFSGLYQRAHSRYYRYLYRAPCSSST